MLAEITIIRRPGEPDQGLPPSIGGGPVYPPSVWPPKGLPPLPPGWWTKPPDLGLWPIEPPDWPIIVPRPPEKPDPGLPGTWPDLPGQGLPGGPGGGGPPPVAGHPLPDTPVVGGGPIYPIGIWPPLPPDAGIAGKCLVLVWIVGIGYRWLALSAGLPGHPLPPTAQPK